MILIMFSLNYVLSQRTLYYEAFTTLSFDHQGQYEYQCGENRVFGGLNNFNSATIITHLIELPPHYLIRISLGFWRFDTQGAPNIYIDYQKIQKSTNNQQIDCLNYQSADVTTFDQTIDHNFKNALIVINTTNLSGYWGINNFTLFIEQCPQGCIVCDSNNQRIEECITWNFAFKSLYQQNSADFQINNWKVQSPISDGNWKTECSNIPLLCGFNICSQDTSAEITIQSNKHSRLKIQFRFFKIDSWDSPEAAFLEIDNIQVWTQQYLYNQGYQSLCGNEYLEIGDNIDINVPHLSEIINLKFYTTLNGSDPNGLNDESFGLRDLWIFKNNRCDVIYYFDCCGDSIKQVGEECDDGNFTPFDGCHNCLYSCDDKCSHCIFGMCIECQEGWELIEIKQQCVKIVDDSILSPKPFQEQNIQISAQFLTNLNEININFQFNQYLYSLTNQCDSFCGDGIVNENEQCDDGNIIPYDGCNLCKFTFSACAIYEMNICQACLDNYYLNPFTNQCESICGDMIVNGEEQCDDGNMIPFDGCDQCFYSCSRGCITCNQGVCLDYIYDQNQSQSISVYISKCQLYYQNECLVCTENYQLNPITFTCETICGDKIISGDEQCDDGNMIPFDGCDQCLYSCSRGCKLCDQGICQDYISTSLKILKFGISTYTSSCKVFYSNKCKVCKPNYYLNSFKHICESKCGDRIVNGMEQCDDGNLIPFDGCYQCKYSCQKKCNRCDRGICLDAIYINQVEKIQSCSPNCMNCSNNQCKICEENYYLNPLTHNCDSLCGDGIVNGNEQCDDGNINPHDNCYMCIYSCAMDCQICLNGKCLDAKSNIENQIELFYSQFISQECVDCINNFCLRCNISNYFLYYQNACQTLCVDNKNLDLNYLPLMCERCKSIKQFQCNSKCSFCSSGQCLQCNKGYTLNNNQCISICGDNLVNREEQEECDNPNSEGCIDCKISSQYKCIGEEASVCWTCDSNCLVCNITNDELFCVKCQDGYFPKDRHCEICESRCITCNLKSSQCTSCYRQDCKLCEDTQGLYTDLEQRKCVSICGDGIAVQGLEDCDDGNNQNWDGCNSICQIETSLDDEDDDENFNIIKEQINNDLIITNSEKIVLKCTDILITIDGFSDQEYTFNSTNLNGTCAVKFTFLKTIDKNNLIHLQIPYEISISRLLLSEYIQYATITPKKQIILSQMQEQQAQMISSSQDQFFLILLIAAPLSIIFGIFEYFWAVLEILSWINNFYYLNVSYPFNAETLLKNSDWSSLVNFPTYSEFNQPEQDYYFQSPIKFMEKGMDPLFINNAQVPFAFILFSIFLYTSSLILYFILSCLDKLLIREEIQKKRKGSFQIFQIKRRQTQTQQTNNNIDQNDEKILLIHNKKVVLALKNIEKLSKDLYGRIKSTISLCIFDITLAATLQITMASQFQYTIILINQVLAYLSLILIINQLYQQYLLINMHPILAQNEEFKFKYGCLYVGVNLESPYGMTYNLIYLIRKVLYIIFTVLCYDNPLFQTSLTFVTSILGVILLIYQNPFDSNKKRIIQFIQEGSISVILFITILYAFDDQTHVVGENSKIISGWIQIAFILLALITEILVLLYEITKAICIKIIAIYKYFILKQSKPTKQTSENQVQNIIKTPEKGICDNQIQEQYLPRFHGINGVLHYLPKRQHQ